MFGYVFSADVEEKMPGYILLYRSFSFGEGDGGSDDKCLTPTKASEMRPSSKKNPPNNRGIFYQE
jgi:hypothetical protein